MLARSILAFALAPLAALALPTDLNVLASRAGAPPTVDAPFSVSQSTVQAAINCPTGYTNAAGGIVLLVHGTGSTGSETWGSGPYTAVLPKLAPGFDVCWVTLPNRSQNDAQFASEYVARAVQILAPKSVTKKVSIIGHSQGNINIQWALAFWPTSRKLVAKFVSLAGDFKGTIAGPLACAAVSLIGGQPGCPASLIQQTTGSNYLTTLNNAAGSALVPTMSLYTIYDQVVLPEVGPGATSLLNGANNYALQDLRLCGPAHYADHLLMVIDPAAFELAHLHLISSGTTVAASQLNKLACFNYIYGTGLNNNTFVKTSNFLKAALFDIASFPTAPKVTKEPTIKAYAAAYA